MANLLPINNSYDLPDIGISSGRRPPPQPRIQIAPNIAPPQNINVPVYRGPGTYSWNTPTTPTQSVSPLSEVEHVIGGLVSPAANLLRTDITNPIRQLSAQVTHNPIAYKNAVQAQNKSEQNLVNEARQFTTRPTVELATSLIPKQNTFTPTNKVEKALLGYTPVQNIEKKVANNYNTHKNLNPLARVGLAAGEAVGSLAQDIPTVGAEAKLAERGIKAAKLDKVATNLKTANEIGAVGKNVNPERALNALKDHQDVLNGVKSEVTVAKISPELSSRIKADTGLTVKPNAPTKLNRPAAIHIEKAHGLRSGDPLPVDDTAKAVMPFVIENPDKIVRGKTVNNVPRIRLERNIGNNRIAVVEVIKKGDSAQVVTYFNDSPSSSSAVRPLGSPQNIRPNRNQSANPSTNIPNQEGFVKIPGQPTQGAKNLGTVRSAATTKRNIASAESPKSPELSKSSPGGSVSRSGEKLPTSQSKPIQTKSAPKIPAAKSSPESLSSANSIKQRGFTQSVKQSANYTKQLKKEVAKTSQYQVATDKAAIAGAQKFAKQPLSLAHSNILKKLQSNAKLSKQDIVNGGTIMQHLDSAGRTSEAQSLHDLLATHLTEAGQKAQAASLLLKRSPDGIYHKAVADLKKAGTEVTPSIDEQLKAHREAIRATAPDTLERNVAVQKMKLFVSKNIPTSKLNNAFAFWRAGLLTGPRTVTKILTSHGVHAPLEKLKDIPASAIDYGLSKATGQRSLVLTTKGGATGLKQGAKLGFGKQGYLRTGIDTQPGTNAIEFHQNANFGTTVPGKIAQAYVDGIGRLHGSLYKPFYGAAHLNSLYSQALAASKNAGLKGLAKDDFVKKFVGNPPGEALDIAKNDAEHTTFQQETALGKLATSLQQHGGIVGKVIAPFTRIPSAIATDLVDYSPAGAMKTIVQGIKAAKSKEGFTLADQRAFSQGLGRSIVGAGALVPGYLLYQTGNLTLAYPTDPKEQKLWQLEGKTADSVKVGGKWRSLGSLGPIGSVLSIGGYIADSISNGKGLTQAAIDGLAGGLKSIEGQSYVSGVSGAVNAVEDPGRYLGNLEKQYAGSVVPTGVAQLASTTDKTARQLNGPSDAIKSKIPGLRESLTPKKNAFGQNVPAGESGLINILDPFYSSKALKTDATVKELQRLNDVGEGTMPSTVPAKNTFNGVKTILTKPQAQALGAQIGRAVKPLWDKTIQSAAYKNQSDEGKRQMLSNILSDTTSAIKNRYAAQNSLGQYAPGFTGNAKPLSAKQQAILTNNFDPTSYIPKVASSTSGTTSKSATVPAHSYKVSNGQIVNSKDVAANYTKFTANLTSAKQSGDINGYMSSAKAKLSNISTQLQDPKITPTKAQQLANEAQSLNTLVAKYSTYGGFTKPRGTASYHSLGTIAGARSDYVSEITKAAAKYGVDANAALAVAAQEGLGGGVGDNGTSFGPFQLHEGGALPPGQTQAWAESPAGIDYALQQISKVAGGLHGSRAVQAIVTGFERSANQSAEINNALALLGGSSASLSPGAPGAARILAGSSGSSRSSKVKTLTPSELRSVLTKSAAIKPPKLPSVKTAKTSAPRKVALKPYAPAKSGFSSGSRIRTRKGIS